MGFTIHILIPLFYMSILNLNLAQPCPPFNCGTLGKVGFPFSNTSNPECGLSIVNCSESIYKVQFGKGGEWYDLREINYETSTALITLRESCHVPDKNSHLLSLNITTQLAVYFKCKPNISHPDYFGRFEKYTLCEYDVYCDPFQDESLPYSYPNCSTIRLPRGSNSNFEPYQPFYVQWKVHPVCDNCRNRGGSCMENGRNIQCSGLKRGNGRKKVIPVAIMAAVVSTIVMFACLGRKSIKAMVSCKGKQEHDKAVETLLKDRRLLALKRYKYKYVEEMTNSFRDKIGQGGYGSVFKGKLPDGCMVAVKILSETTTDGKEFINEVASISRTSHVNIVSLIGFCIDEPKRALVYEFMPNGSLEKFIYNETPSNIHRHLGWETIYNIAIGIARGLEYLHRGCCTPILHFDIKPHNILLDQNFNPKIADFGLSKLCHVTDSVVSMTRARGTTGYIAPEVVSRNFGVVSHKSDVYSYVMMVLEMVGGRKNIDPRVSDISEIYFPHWVYKHLNLNENLELHGVTTLEEQEIAKKMILVGLWCIQIDPQNRPPISRVLDMLAGSLEALQLPPKPFPSSPPREEEFSL